jgi:hypothetical protein
MPFEDAGYDLEQRDEGDEPTDLEQRLAGSYVVCTRGDATDARWRSLARIGELRLYLVEQGRFPAAYLGRAARWFDRKPFAEPLVARRRGRIAIDAAQRLCDPYPVELAAPPRGDPGRSPRPSRRGRAGGARSRAGGADDGGAGEPIQSAFAAIGLDAAANLPAPPRPAPIRVAVLDAEWADHERLRGVAPPRERLIPGLPPSRTPTAKHGTVLAASVLASGVAEVGLFRIPADLEHEKPYPYLGVTGLALAIADAVEEWNADVVLWATNVEFWGAPRHLREVTREAEAVGRRGRGAILVASAGDTVQSGGVVGGSWAMPVDEPAALHGVITVAASQLIDARWYRAPGELRFPMSRLGPSIELAAPGDWFVVGDGLVTDDTSGASSLVAAGCALVLRHNPDLRADELRAIVRMTATLRARVDGQTGAESGVCNEIDHARHNLKLGHGQIDVLAACLAASDPICFALLATRHEEPGRDELCPRLAAGWNEAAHRAAATSPIARDYLGLRGRLVIALLRSSRLREALLWLARHVRELAASPRDPGNRWFGADSHEALVQRVLVALRIAGEVATGAAADAGPVNRFAHRVERVISSGHGRSVAAFVADVIRAAVGTQPP